MKDFTRKLKIWFECAWYGHDTFRIRSWQSYWSHQLLIEEGCDRCGKKRIIDALSRYTMLGWRHRTW